MQRNRANSGQGLLGNAPVGFGGGQSNAFGNPSFGNNLQGFGRNGCSNNISPGPHQNRGFGNSNGNSSFHNNHRSDFVGKQVPDFGSGNRAGNTTSFNGSGFNSNNHHQQNRNNGNGMQGVGGILPMQQQRQQQQQQQQQQSRQPMGQMTMGGGSSQGLNNGHQMNQIFNANRDSQLALVNSLLKGSLIPNSNSAMNLQNKQGLNNATNSLGNMQQHQQQHQQQQGNGMGFGLNLNPLNNMSQGGMNALGMGMNNMQANNGGPGMAAMGQNQFSMGSQHLNSSGTGNMGMTSPGGGGGGGGGNHGNGGGGQSILGVPHQGLLGNQNSLLGNPSLARNPDFMQRNSGVLLGRPNSSRSALTRSPPYHHPHPLGGRPSGLVTPSRSTPTTPRGRPERRAPHDHRRHPSRDSRDSHDSRDGRPARHDRPRRDDHRNEFTEKRQVALPPSGGCESLRVSVSDGQEEYDPAEPTEDHAETRHNAQNALLADADADHDLGSPDVTVFHAGQKRPRSHSPVSRSHPSPGDLKVTIDEKGRSVQDGPPQPKRRESSGSDGKDGESGDQKFTCYACSVDCKDIQHFESHMRSARHRARMESICNLHVQKTDQQLARMRAEEHLRRIEGREKEDYCRICDKRFVGSFITHRRGQEHRRKERLTKRGCKLCRTGSFVQYCEYVKHIDSEPHKKQMKLEQRPSCSLCRMSFHSPKTFVAHCKTESHKQKKEELRRQEQGAHSGREEEEDDDTQSFPDSFDELVTLDATGIYRHDHDHQAEVVSESDYGPHPPADDDTDQASSTREPGPQWCQGQGLKDTTSWEERTLEEPLTEEGEEEDPLTDEGEDIDEDMRNAECAKPEAVEEKYNTENLPNDTVPSKSNDPCSDATQGTPTTIPIFDPQIAIGQDHVIPVKGFFCKLCKKFYMNEETARSVHCRSLAHFNLYNEYQKALQLKQIVNTSVVKGTLAVPECSVVKSEPAEECEESPDPQDPDLSAPANGVHTGPTGACTGGQGDGQGAQHDQIENSQSDSQEVERDEVSVNSSEDQPHSNGLTVDPTPGDGEEGALVNGVGHGSPVVNGSCCTPDHPYRETNGAGHDQEEEDLGEAEVQVKTAKTPVKRSARVRRGRARKARAK